MALNRRPIFEDKKVIICALRFIQFVVYSMRNPVYLSNLKHASSRELPLSARKTVFSHLKGVEFREVST